MSQMREQERNLGILRRIVYTAAALLVIAGALAYFGREIPPGGMNVQRADSTGYEPPPVQGVMLHNVPWTGGRAPYQPISTDGDVYKTNCAMCHGDTGQADGPVADSYQPRPPSLITAAVRSESDALLFRKIREGIRSATIPEARKYLPNEWHAYRAIMSDDEIHATVRYMRHLEAQHAPSG